MIAHEAVHAAQFASDLPRASTARLEAEADALAPHLAAGGRARVRLGAAPGRLHWGRVGHYYTTYLAGLVAGADAATAQRMAVYTQVPDLVSELDATKQVATRLEVMDMTGMTPVGAYVGPDRGVRPDDPEICLDVIEGLHALTGAGATDERRRRRAVLANTAWGSLKFGVALHAFGDSYAHARPSGGSMFGHDIGHAFALHYPDMVGWHQQTYWDFYDDLLRVLKLKVAGGGPGPGAPSEEKIRSELVRMTQEMPDGDDEAVKIPFMRTLIASMSPAASLTYEPPDACVPWADFIKTSAAPCLPLGDPEDGGDYAKILASILRWGREWRFNGPDTRPLATRLKEIDDKRKWEAEIARAQSQAMRMHMR